MREAIYENRLKEMKVMELKAITIRDLTEAGFERREDLDFADDGTRFKILEYRGMIISYAKANGEYYIAIRPDYLENSGGHSFYSKLEAYKNVDEFNGVSKVSVGKLVQNVEQLVKEMNR
mgnify:CR=1 FL=1